MTERGADGTVGDTEVPQPTADGQGEPEDALIGQLVDGRYRIERRLGEGGMGLVYKAVHQGLDKTFAIKVLRAEVSKNEEIVARFQQEAKSASAIGNRHIIDIIDFGVLPGGATYFVMEFLSGSSLTRALESGRFTPKRTVHVARQLCKALGAAHEAGIVHRDLKPDNVQLLDPGDRDFVKVLDFGIAKVSGSATKLTQVGQVFGTPHYMSPEQCEGNEVDHRTDIYAVGVMLYEMATGRVPFDADSLMAVLSKHLHKAPTPPSEVSSPIDVPAALEAVILKCLNKAPDDRYPSMAALLADLEAADLGRTPSAVPADGKQRTTPRAPQRTEDFPPVEASTTLPRYRTSRRWIVAAAVLGATGALTLAAAALWPADSPGKDSARAQPPSAGEATPVVAAPRTGLPAIVSAEAQAKIAAAAPDGSAAQREPASVPKAEIPAATVAAPVATVPVITEPVAQEPPAEAVAGAKATARRRPPPARGAAARTPRRKLPQQSSEPRENAKSDPLDAILDQNTRRLDTILDM